MTAGNQGSVGGSNQNSQTANEEQINKSLSSHSSLNHIYVPMEQQRCWSESVAVKGAQFGVSQSSRGVSEGAVGVQEEEGVPAPVSHPALPSQWERAACSSSMLYTS